MLFKIDKTIRPIRSAAGKCNRQDLELKKPINYSEIHFYHSVVFVQNANFELVKQ